MTDRKRTLVVGLGNPGSKYASTRHNAGFEAVDSYVWGKGDLWTFDKDANADTSAYFGVIAVKPRTFMNNSGEAVRKLVDYWKVEPENVIIIHDEIDFKVGVMKIKVGGSAGGHNGLKSIIQHIGPDFIRLRIGVDRPEGDGSILDHVLGKFKTEEMEKYTVAKNLAAQAVHEIISTGVTNAMNYYNKWANENNKDSETQEG